MLHFGNIYISKLRFIYVPYSQIISKKIQNVIKRYCQVKIKKLTSSARIISPVAVLMIIRSKFYIGLNFECVTRNSNLESYLYSMATSIA